MSAGAVERVPRALDDIEDGVAELERTEDRDLIFVESARFTAIWERINALAVRLIGRTSATAGDEPDADSP